MKNISFYFLSTLTAGSLLATSVPMAYADEETAETTTDVSYTGDALPMTLPVHERRKLMRDRAQAKRARELMKQRGESRWEGDENVLTVPSKRSYHMRNRVTTSQMKLINARRSMRSEGTLPDNAGNPVFKRRLDFRSRALRPITQRYLMMKLQSIRSMEEIREANEACSGHTGQAWSMCMKTELDITGNEWKSTIEESSESSSSSSASSASSESSNAQ